MNGKLAELQKHLSHLKKVAVAFSGGVDSTLLLRVACDTLGPEQVLAVTACTQLVPRHEQQEARQLAEQFGVQHLLLHEDVLALPEVADNPVDRCYHCKRHIFSTFRRRCTELGFEHLVDGTNLDDLGEDRPGLRALEELQIGSPLAECHLDKQAVRELSRELGLPTAERPAFACLATRIPFGTPLTKEKLTRVESCERFLAELGFTNYRVRCHEELARIEVNLAEIPRLLETTTRERIREFFQTSGFTYVTLDLQGLRSGSMGEVLAPRSQHAKQ